MQGGGRHDSTVEYSTVQVEGAMNPQHIVKAFMLGLLRQKTHQVRRLILIQAPS